MTRRHLRILNKVPPPQISQKEKYENNNLIITFELVNSMQPKD